MLQKILPSILIALSSALTCEWYGSGYGVDIQCLPGWAAFGICGSGSRANCKSSFGSNSYYYMLYCCQTKYTNNKQGNCHWTGHSAGQLNTCKDDDGYNQAIYGGCGSGRGQKCGVSSNATTTLYHNSELCCDNNDISISPDAKCGWKYGTHGDLLTCPSGYIGSGLCGSGRNAACESGATTSGIGIYCCPYTDNRS